MTNDMQATDNARQGGRCRIVWCNRLGAGQGGWWPDYMRYQLLDVIETWNRIHGEGSYRLETKR